MPHRIWGLHAVFSTGSFWMTNESHEEHQVIERVGQRCLCSSIVISKELDITQLCTKSVVEDGFYTSRKNIIDAIEEKRWAWNKTQFQQHKQWRAGKALTEETHCTRETAQGEPDPICVSYSHCNHSPNLLLHLKKDSLSSCRALLHSDISKTPPHRFLGCAPMCVNLYRPLDQSNKLLSCSIAISWCCNLHCSVRWDVKCILWDNVKTNGKVCTPVFIVLKFCDS